MSALPGHVTAFLLVLSLFSFIICVMLPLAVSAWKLFRTNSPGKELEKQIGNFSPEWVYGTGIGLIGIDIALYMTQRSVLPRNVFYITTGTLNFLVLILLAYYIFACALVALRRRRLLAFTNKQITAEEAAVEVEP